MSLYSELWVRQEPYANVSHVVIYASDYGWVELTADDIQTYDLLESLSPGDGDRWLNLRGAAEAREAA